MEESNKETGPVNSFPMIMLTSNTMSNGETRSEVIDNFVTDTNDEKCLKEALSSEKKNLQIPKSCIHRTGDSRDPLRVSFASQLEDYFEYSVPSLTPTQSLTPPIEIYISYDENEGDSDEDLGLTKWHISSSLESFCIERESREDNSDTADNHNAQNTETKRNDIPTKNQNYAQNRAEKENDYEDGAADLSALTSIPNGDVPDESPQLPSVEEKENETLNDHLKGGVALYINQHGIRDAVGDILSEIIMQAVALVSPNIPNEQSNVDVYAPTKIDLTMQDDEYESFPCSQKVNDEVTREEEDSQDSPFFSLDGINESGPSSSMPPEGTPQTISNAPYSISDPKEANIGIEDSTETTEPENSNLDNGKCQDNVNEIMDPSFKAENPMQSNSEMGHHQENTLENEMLEILDGIEENRVSKNIKFSLSDNHGFGIAGSIIPSSNQCSSICNISEEEVDLSPEIIPYRQLYQLVAPVDVKKRNREFDQTKVVDENVSDNTESQNMEEINLKMEDKSKSDLPENDDKCQAYLDKGEGTNMLDHSGEISEMYSSPKKQNSETQKKIYNPSLLKDLCIQKISASIIKMSETEMQVTEPEVAKAKILLNECDTILNAKTSDQLSSSSVDKITNEGVAEDGEKLLIDRDIESICSVNDGKKSSSPVYKIQEVPVSKSEVVDSMEESKPKDLGNVEIESQKTEPEVYEITFGVRDQINDRESYTDHFIVERIQPEESASIVNSDMETFKKEQVDELSKAEHCQEKDLNICQSTEEYSMEAKETRSGGIDHITENYNISKDDLNNTPPKYENVKEKSSMEAKESEICTVGSQSAENDHITENNHILINEISEPQVQNLKLQSSLVHLSLVDKRNESDVREETLDEGSSQPLFDEEDETDGEMHQWDKDDGKDFNDPNPGEVHELERAPENSLKRRLHSDEACQEVPEKMAKAEESNPQEEPEEMNSRILKRAALREERMGEDPAKKFVCFNSEEGRVDSGDGGSTWRERCEDQAVPEEEENEKEEKRRVKAWGEQEIDSHVLDEESLSLYDEEGKKDMVLKTEGSYKWSYAPSVDFDSVAVLHSTSLDSTDQPPPLVQPLHTCKRPLRVGLSKRQKFQSLHPNYRSKP